MKQPQKRVYFANFSHRTETKLPEMTPTRFRAWTSRVCVCRILLLEGNKQTTINSKKPTSQISCPFRATTTLSGTVYGPPAISVAYSVRKQLFCAKETKKKIFFTIFSRQYFWFFLLQNITKGQPVTFQCGYFIGPPPFNFNDVFVALNDLQTILSNLEITGQMSAGRNCIFWGKFGETKKEIFHFC